MRKSGYRCRLIPLPIPHRQPYAAGQEPRFVVEPLWTQLVPVVRTTQYVLCWYAAETLSESAERAANVAAMGRESATEEQLRSSTGFVVPETWPVGMTVKERVAEDVDGGKTYEPLRHEGTGVDDEEATYTSYLVDVAEARRLLRGSVMEDVVKRAWNAICLRRKMEEEG